MSTKDHFFMLNSSPIQDEEKILKAFYRHLWWKVYCTVKSPQGFWSTEAIKMPTMPQNNTKSMPVKHLHKMHEKLQIRKTLCLDILRLSLRGFIHNDSFSLKLTNGPNKSVYTWQAFPTFCNVTFKLKGSFINKENEVLWLPP